MSDRRPAAFGVVGGSFSLGCGCGYNAAGQLCTIGFGCDGKHGVHFAVAPPVDMVNHPPHYQGHPSGLECIEVTRRMTFSAGNALKYVWRADLKNGVEDLRKALWYLDDAIASGDAVWLPGAQDWEEMPDSAALPDLMLSQVAWHEPNLDRQRFFDLMAAGLVTEAREIVRSMLAVTS